jgi:hypothetical protein
LITEQPLKKVLLEAIEVLKILLKPYSLELLSFIIILVCL